MTTEARPHVRAEHSSVSEYLRQSLNPEELTSIGLLSFNQWTFAMGAMIDTGLAARELGSRVILGFWADETPLHDVGWDSSTTLSKLFGTQTKDQRAEVGLRTLGLPPEAFAKPPIRQWRPIGLPSLPEPLTRARVRSLTYQGSDMGRAILQVHPNFNTPIREDYVWPRRWVENAMKSYAWAYDRTIALIKEHKLGTVVVYNGRFTHDRAVAAAAEHAGVKVLNYDTGGYDTAFDLTPAHTHDWAHLQDRMKSMYSNWGDDRDDIGSSWFTNRQTHKDESLLLFVGAQTIGHLEQLPEAEQLVVFFSSSGDEIAELDIDWADYLQSQEAALTALAAACRDRPGTKLVVRTHPHLRFKPADDLAGWLEAVARAAPDAHIDPHSPVDSYTLMKRADIVFTYGSTAGIEAAFMGKPVVVMGPSAYDELGCVQRIKTAPEIPNFLMNPPTPNPTNAIPFGLMMQRRGFNYEHLDSPVSGEPLVGGVALDDASEIVRKIGHASVRLRTWWLTRK
jgi:hypothetical protein